MEDENESDSMSFEQFCVSYKEVLAANGVSPHLFKSLHRKLEKEIYDAGEYFLLTPEEDSQQLKAVVAREEGLQISDSDAIFLIDHAWTYKISDAQKQLCEIPGLLPRIAEMFGYSIHGEVFTPEDTIVKNILREMWKYNQTYSLGSSVVNERIQMWYILDEFGTTIKHSDSPTVVLFPFYYLSKQMSFSVMVPRMDLDYGDEITRDYANYEKDALIRKCKLLPWFPSDFSQVSAETPLFSDKSYENRFNAAKEILPVACCNANKVPKKRLKIFLDVYGEYLTDVTSFEIVDDVEEADVFYTTKHIQDFRRFSEDRPDLYLSQFPGEMLLSCKDTFMDLAKRSTSNGTTPRWLAISFELNSQFSQFVSNFLNRAQRKNDRNIWICKPLNLARGLDILITDNLNEIIRLRDTDIPMIACKYIEDPVLILSPEAESLVKFDLRFIVFLSSVNPLQVHVCSYFYARLANKAFSLDDLNDIDCHFTAQTAEDSTPATPRMSGHDFVSHFQDQYPNYSWDDLLDHIHGCISLFFKSATSRPPPYGLGHYSNSRAMYGVDVMLEWDLNEVTGDKIIEPILLECNYGPDIYTICHLYPSFLSDAFKFLFLGEESCEVVDLVS